MRPARPDGNTVDWFFEGLVAAVLEELDSPAGAAYDRTLYAIGMEYGAVDARRALDYAVGPRHGATPTDKVLASLGQTPYPRLARRRLPGQGIRGTAAILHFFDASYPLHTEPAERALVELGFELPSPLQYVDYVHAIDRLKERCPASAVPESNWFLSRILQVGLEAWSRRQARREANPGRRVAGAAPAQSTVARNPF
ncbi:MAG: hypothetical protein HYT80_09995 [Euryarchaeota archaeon]|nr:hypothetical protein [Euryarchaeota archaeon]